jgi:hypothetical protein
LSGQTAKAGGVLYSGGGDSRASRRVCLDLHMIARRPLPATVLDGLAPLLASVTTWDAELFVMYQAVLAGVAPAMSPANQALCSRICALRPQR